MSVQEPSGASRAEPAVAVVAERDGAGLWLRINRPEAMNSIDEAVVHGLQRGLDQAADDESVRCVVLTGTGRAFCAGADLAFVREASADDGSERFLDLLGGVLNRIESFPKPVIAAVNGVAVAGGLEIVLCCDLVVAVQSARLGDAHANYGLLPGGGGTVRLARKIGPTRAKYLIFTGKLLTAPELEQSGLVNAVVPDAELRLAVGTLVQSIADKSSLGLARMKQLVNDALEQPVQIGLRAELTASALHRHSTDMQEGLLSFQEKRKPVFTGH